MLAAFKVTRLEVSVGIPYESLAIRPGIARGTASIGIEATNSAPLAAIEGPETSRPCVVFVQLDESSPAGDLTLDASGGNGLHPSGYFTGSY